MRSTSSLLYKQHYLSRCMLIFSCKILNYKCLLVVHSMHVVQLVVDASLILLSFFHQIVPNMASVHTTMTSLVCKNANHSVTSKLPSTSFLPGFDVTGNSASTWKKEICPPSFSGPRATLTFDPPSTNSEKTKQRKHTVDPASPDFLPLPSFEQCFPRSTKEHRCAFCSFLFS